MIKKYTIILWLIGDSQIQLSNSLLCDFRHILNSLILLENQSEIKL